MNSTRSINVLKETIGRLDLKLTGLKVLTEVGSGPYLYSPVIAAMAGAEEVMAWTRDTVYGTAESNIEECSKILTSLGLNERVNFFIGESNDQDLTKADIITNSGLLRPLDKNKLMHVREGAVIPLMYEKWEFRHADLDLSYCLNSKIKVAGTWEDHPDLQIFQYVGPLAVKMAFEAGYEVFRNKIIIWSDDNFGDVAKKGFENIGAREVLLTTDFNELMAEVKDTDFIFICDYSEKRAYLDNNFFWLNKLLDINPSLGIVHLYGDFDFENASEHIQNYYPRKNGRAQQMSFTLGHVGLNPVLNLQIAGLKVGELVRKGITNSLVQNISTIQIDSGH